MVRMRKPNVQAQPQETFATSYCLGLLSHGKHCSPKLQGQGLRTGGCIGLNQQVVV